MKNLIVSLAAVVFSLWLPSVASADNFNTGTGELQGNGFESSGNHNAVLNAGAGNAGENFEGFHQNFPVAVGSESGLQSEDEDPGQSGEHNQAPSTVPGQ
jgi:hypothetical protein